MTTQLLEQANRLNAEIERYQKRLNRVSNYGIFQTDINDASIHKNEILNCLDQSELNQIKQIMMDALTRKISGCVTEFKNLA